MDLLQGIVSRFSVRSYISKPVEFDKVTAVLEAAHYAPSPGNLQNWRFVVITDPSLRQRIAEHCVEQFWIAQAPVLIVVVSDDEVVEAHYGLRGKRLYGVQACAAAIENMLLAAHALGLGACWVGAFDEGFISEVLGIPSSARPQAIITLGYTDEKPPEVKDRSGLETVVFFNAYGSRVKNVSLLLRDYASHFKTKFDENKPYIVDSLKKIKEKVSDLKEKVSDKVKKN